MGDSIEALIPKTQELLQPLIAKPKLADKLLMKPPFRFLHDVFAALTQATGFAKGLYNEFELDSGNMKEKNQKITYLDKMVVCVGQCLGKDVDVRSAKIVAGLEPENTNLFLQALAQAASNATLDWTGAVQRTLAKIPSLTPDGGAALPTATAPAAGSTTTAAAAAPAEAKTSAPVAADRPASKERPTSKERPGSKERPSSSEAEKAAAAADAKAKDKARKDKEADAAAKAKAAADTPAVADPKSSSSANSAARGAKAPSDNNSSEVDDALAQQIRACTGDVERTKDALEKIIQKPKMAAKLLSKPPFRFIHDIVSEVTRVTGFADGLYSADELDSSTIKDKQPKIEYLTKILQCVGCQLNVDVDAKPAKIVAGLEPDDTNKFLQLLAIACRAGSSADAVQRVLAGDTAVRVTSASAGKKTSAGSAAAPSKTAATPAERDATPEAKLSSRSTTPLETKGRPTSKDGKDANVSAGPGAFGGPVKPLALRGDDDESDANTNLRFDAKNAAVSDDQQQSQHVAPGTSGGLGTSRTSRPTTARRRPPKLKENVTEVGRLMVHDPKVTPVVGIMKDGDNNDSDDDDAATDDIGGSSRTAALHDDGGAHGKLVRDILKDQSADDAAARKHKDDDTDTAGAGDADTGIRLGRRKKSFKDKAASGASSAAEMAALRGRIQRICQAANPVGKGVEFVHDDVDAMAKELEHWKREAAAKRELLDDERKRTDEALQPLQRQLLEVDELIKEQVHKINALKATIAKNDDKTHKLLHMVVSA